jgi:hypothetical protein
MRYGSYIKTERQINRNNDAKREKLQFYKIQENFSFVCFLASVPASLLSAVIRESRVIQVALGTQSGGEKIVKVEFNRLCPAFQGRTGRCSNKCIINTTFVF